MTKSRAFVFIPSKYRYFSFSYNAKAIFRNIEPHQVIYGKYTISHTFTHPYDIALAYNILQGQDFIIIHYYP